MGDEADFLPEDKYKSSLQTDSITLGITLARHAQSTQNKFALSLQYLKKEVSDKVDFLYANTPESFLQIDIKYDF